jgi:hypothetical protein
MPDEITGPGRGRAAGPVRGGEFGAGIGWRVFFFFFLARFGFGFSSYVRFPHPAHKRIAAANEFNIIL